MKHKIAVIGTGYMAQKHCDVLRSYNNVILDTIVSTKNSQRIGKQFKKKYGFLKTTTDFDSILQDDRIDTALICTPDSMHAAQTSKLLRAGKNVLCEKPLARTKKDFDLLRKDLKKSNKILQVGMNCRFREQYSKPKKIISSKKLGKLRFLSGNYIINDVDSLKNNQKQWLYDYPSDIFPILHGGGIHCLDLLGWIGGKIKKVHARASSSELVKQLKSDTFFISLEFEKKVFGNCIISSSSFQPNSFELDYWLTNGTILNNTIVYKRKNNHVTSGDKIVVEQKKIDLRLQFENLIKSIKEGVQPLNSFEEAYKNFKVINAVERSVKSGQIINID